MARKNVHIKIVCCAKSEILHPNMQPTQVWHFRMCIWLWHANKVYHANGIQFSSTVTTNQHL